MDEMPMVSLKLERKWPEWFSLDYSPASGLLAPSLSIGFNKHVLTQFLGNLPESYLRILHEELSKCDADTAFLSDPEKLWGFGEVLRPSWQNPPDKSLAWYHIFIPQIEKETGKKCKECRGKGRNIDLDMDCLRCGGNGKETIMDWKEANRISATLSLLSLLFTNPKKEWFENLQSSRRQLLSFEIFFREGCAPLSAVLSEDFANVLRSISRKELPGVKEALKTSYLHMFLSFGRFDDYHYKAYVQDGGQLILDVPGSACGLYVDGFDMSLMRNSGPMKLDCHNVDTHAQQLSLLCGLAALAGTVRRELGD